LVTRISRDEASLDVLIEAVEAIDEPILVEEDGKARLVAMSPQHFERLRGEGIESELASHDDNQQGR
jgi:hypothetical protein